MNVKRCGFFGALALASAVCADEVHKKYDLYQDVSIFGDNKSSALENAKWWVDSAGEYGVDGETPDVNGDYYSHGYRLDTQNVTGQHVFFDCHSLHIGDEDKAGTLNVFISMGSSSFGVGGEGLFLHRGSIGVQWMPVTLKGRITVESSADAPFAISDGYSGTTLYLQSTLSAAAGKTLRFYANNRLFAQTPDRQFTVDVTGDCSSFYGTLKVAKDEDADGRTTRLVIHGTKLPGTLEFAKTGILELGSDASTVGSLTLADGATLALGGGTLTVTDSFAMAGRVTVSGTVADFANVTAPTIDFLTLPEGSTCDPELFDSTVTVAADGKPATAAIRFRTNSDGTKTLYVDVARKTVYVSPSGDDANAGTREAPFRTLAHSVAQCAGGVICALPGTYAEGVCDESAEATQSRVHLPANTLLVSTDGAASTTIAGARPTDGGDFGPGAMRCARLDSGAILQGFTLTGGFVYLGNAAGKPDSDFANSTGGGVLGSDGSLVLECIVDGNTAYRGGGCRGGAYVRCTFGMNVAIIGKWSGTDVFGIQSQGSGVTRLFDCLFTRVDATFSTSVYHSVLLYNCTMLNEGPGGISLLCKACNCLIKANVPAGNSDYYNCILGMMPTMAEKDAAPGSLYEAVNCEASPVSLDDKYRPRLRSSRPIDFGDTAAYTAAWDAAGIDRAHFGTDYAGGPRIVNGAIDAGCGEFNRPINVGTVFSVR